MKDKQSVSREWFNVPMYLSEPPTSETIARDRASSSDGAVAVPGAMGEGDELCPSPAAANASSQQHNTHNGGDNECGSDGVATPAVDVDDQYSWTRCVQAHHRFEESFESQAEAEDHVQHERLAAALVAAFPPEHEFEDTLDYETEENEHATVTHVDRQEDSSAHRHKNHQALFHAAAVARPVGKKELEATPKARDSRDKEWKKLWEKKVRDYDGWEDWDKVSNRARKDGRKIHIGRLFGICVEKGSELPADDDRRKIQISRSFSRQPGRH